MLPVMKHLTLALALALSSFAFALPSHAGDKAKAAESGSKPESGKAAAASSDVTMHGTLMCAKCSLKETSDCQTVLKVSDAGKDTKYYLENNDVTRAHHGAVCGSTAQATVKGSVSTVKGQKHLTPTEIKIPG